MSSQPEMFFSQEIGDSIKNIRFIGLEPRWNRGAASCPPSFRLKLIKRIGHADYLDLWVNPRFKVGLEIDLFGMQYSIAIYTTLVIMGLENHRVYIPLGTVLQNSTPSGLMRIVEQYVNSQVQLTVEKLGESVSFRIRIPNMFQEPIDSSLAYEVEVSTPFADCEHFFVLPQTA